MPAVERGVLDALGHDRPGRLLEAHAQVGRRGGVGPVALGVEQHLGEGVHLGQQVGPGRPCPLDRLEQRRPQLGRVLQAGPDVGPVGVHVDEQLGERRPQPVLVVPGERLDRATHQPAHLRLQEGLHGLPLAPVDLHVEVGLPAGGEPRRRHRVGGRGVHQRGGDRGVGVVAGRAGARPAARQPLVALEDLLHPHGGARTHRGGEGLQVCRGVGQPVGVVDAEPVDDAVVVQVEQLGVGGLEDVPLLDAHADELVDLEEPPVVEDLGRVLPEAQPPVLGLQQRRQVVQQVLGAGGHRPDVVEVAHDRLAGDPPLALVLPTPVDGELAGGEHLLEGGAQDGQPEPSVEVVPVDVEPVGAGRAPALAQGLPDGRVAPQRLDERHVVGDDVDDHPHAAGVRGVRQAGEPLATAELGADPGVVEHVVAVLGAGHRGEHGREVEVADAEGLHVGQDRLGVGEGEAGVQLHPVGGGQRAAVGGVRVRHGCSSVPARTGRRPFRATAAGPDGSGGRRRAGRALRRSAPAAAA